MGLIQKIESVNELNWISNQYILDKADAISLLDDFENRNKIVFPVGIKEFLAEVNGKMFYDWVQYKGLEYTPSLNGHIGDLGLFYSLKRDTQYDLWDAQVANEDLFEEEDFLFAEGTPGDFLVISLSKKTYGEIFLLVHDYAEDEKKRFHVAKNMADFISSLFIKEMDD